MPGCAVGISRNGSVLYEHGYGMANLEWRVPITPSINVTLSAGSLVLAMIVLALFAT